MPLSIKDTQHSPSTLYHVGKIEDILKSDLPPEALQKTYHAKDFKYGFELATPSKNLASLGEAIMVGGLCYANSSDAHAKEYMHTLSGEAFKAAGVFIIPHEAKPSHKVTFTDNKPLSVLEFYAKLYNAVNHPFAFTGLLEFSTLYANAICKAPINHHSIFEHKPEFYNQPEVHHHNVSAFIMGVVANLNQAEGLDLNLSAVLYRNPFDKADNLNHHAHILTLKDKPQTTADIESTLADRVLHLLAEGSAISAFHGEIYTIGMIKAWESSYAKSC